MTDKWDTYGKIRMMHLNGMSDRQIARILGVGRRTVRKYRDGAVTPDVRAPVKEKLKHPRKATLKEAAESEIVRMLKENALLPKKQRLSAKDMWNVLCEQGILISEVHTRRIVREIRDECGDEFIPLAHEPGDCVQIDWLEDVVVFIGGVRTKVQVFVCALPHSGAVCAFVYPDKTMLSFLSGHVMAFEWLKGVSKRALYDNHKAAVYSGSGLNAQIQERFKHFTLHYAFTAEFCNRASGWEKSNAENGVKITRNHAFVPIPHVKDYGELQNHVSACLLKYNMTHKTEGRSLKIWDMFLLEQASLNPLPLSPYEVDETVQKKVYPDQTIRYDKVRYSVPHGHVGKNVTLRVSPFKVKIYFRGEVLFEHERIRPGGSDQHILDHYLEALFRKPRAAGQALPIKKGVMPKECRAFLDLCPAKDKNKQLVDLMLIARDTGMGRMLAAMESAILSGKPTKELVCYYLYGQQMPDDAFKIKHNDLSDYDSLLREENTDE